MKVGVRPMQGGGCFEESLAQVTRAEEVGFDSVWLTEHHGWDTSWPSPQLALAGYATVTDRVALGTGIVLLPLANPVRLAGEYALLDRMSNGRTILGVGLGYQQREFDAFDVPMDERVARFVDNIRLLQQLWNGGMVDFSGKSYELTDFELSPKPVQPGGPPIWCGGDADPALKRMARLDCEWLASWTLMTDQLLERAGRYREYISDFGMDPRDKTNPVVRAVVVAESTEVALDRARRSIQPVIDAYIEEGHRIGTERDSSTDVTDLIGNGLVVGDPAEVVDQLSAFLAVFDTDHLVLKIHGPGMGHEETIETIDVLGDQVLPQLSGG